MGRRERAGRIVHRKHGETRQRLLFAELNHRTEQPQMLSHCSPRPARDRPRDARRPRRSFARVAAMRRPRPRSTIRRSDRFDSAPSCLVCEAAAGPLARSRLDLHCEAGRLARRGGAPRCFSTSWSARRQNVADSEDGGRPCPHRTEGRFVLAVEDDGPGFDLGEVRRKSSGLGLVAGLARQIGAGFRVERHGGARCLLEFSGLPGAPE